MRGCHLIAFCCGFILDMMLGDPVRMPHPVRLIGLVITKLEKKLYRGKNLLFKGCILTILTAGFVLLVSSLLLAGAYLVGKTVGILVESVMTWQILAAKSLTDESMKVYDRLQDADLEGARYAVSMIVGRDTACLDSSGVIRAAVETVAENTSDGVIAPMIYLALGGPVLGFLYKAVNTMDSMIGYKNERYLYFGRMAAKADDFLNYIPARISAGMMLLSAFLLGRNFDGKRAYRIYRRDRKKHASPNAAQTESVLAGALGIRLAGDAYYFGKLVKKPYIGDDDRPVEAEDIRRANRLMRLSAVICEGVCIICMLLCLQG